MPIPASCVPSTPHSQMQRQQPWDSLVSNHSPVIPPAPHQGRPEHPRAARASKVFNPGYQGAQRHPVLGSCGTGPVHEADAVNPKVGGPENPCNWRVAGVPERVDCQGESSPGRQAGLRSSCSSPPGCPTAPNPGPAPPTEREYLWTSGLQRLEAPWLFKSRNFPRGSQWHLQDSPGDGRALREGTDGRALARAASGHRRRSHSCM